MRVRSEGKDHGYKTKEEIGEKDLVQRGTERTYLKKLYKATEGQPRVRKKGKNTGARKMQRPKKKIPSGVHPPINSGWEGTHSMTHLRPNTESSPRSGQ